MYSAKSLTQYMTKHDIMCDKKAKNYKLSKFRQCQWEVPLFGDP